MSRIAIIAAMSGELKPLTRGWIRTRPNGVDLWRQPQAGGEWIAACAGAGVAAATRAFAEVEASGPIDAVLSIGWAGALRPELLPGQAYCAAGVIDARTGERFETSGYPERTEALKGHGFSRAAEPQKSDAALAAEGMQTENDYSAGCGTAKAVPFQSDLWGVTTPRVADAAEKQRLAAAYGAALVEMEAAAIARLAQMREIPFYCVKGISDGYSDKLPDFNRFILPNGRFRLAAFVLFALLRPRHWLPLMRMGENSKSASRRIAERVLGILYQEGSIKKPND
jgi:adenosylhomocysteine nucleosidase